MVPIWHIPHNDCFQSFALDGESFVAFAGVCNDVVSDLRDIFGRWLSFVTVVQKNLDIAIAAPTSQRMKWGLYHSETISLHFKSEKIAIVSGDRMMRAQLETRRVAFIRRCFVSRTRSTISTLCRCLLCCIRRRYHLIVSCFVLLPPVISHAVATTFVMLALEAELLFILAIVRYIPESSLACAHVWSNVPSIVVERKAKYMRTSARLCRMLSLS